MKLSDYHFDLPSELIAQNPPEKREQSRLLRLTRYDSNLRDLHFTDLLAQLSTNDLLVFNNTKVIPARLMGRKESGGQVEVMLEHIIDERQFLAQVRASKSPKLGSKVIISKSVELDSVELEMLSRQDNLFLFSIRSDVSTYDLFQRAGKIPLPPYIKRQANKEDSDRYQTVYAKELGAVAAPTAGLHFSHNILAELSKKGINSATLTLHVGSGTFLPVRTENIENHKMHKEYFQVDDLLIKKIQETKQANGRIIAVGTTVVRTLESLALKCEKEGLILSRLDGHIYS